MLRYTTDRARPGLVTFYDIRPGNRADLFLQPRNLQSEGYKEFGPNPTGSKARNK